MRLHTGGMPLSDESLEEIREKHARELAEWLRKARRERRSFYAFCIAWFVYLGIVPFTTSPGQIIPMLVVLLIFYAQYVYFMD